MPVDDAVRDPDARKGRRYPLRWPVIFTVSENGVIVRSGCGKTWNLSTTGILFKCRTLLPCGSRIQLRVAWPVKPPHTQRFELVLQGFIVRSGPDGTAVRIIRKEFVRHGGRETKAEVAPRRTFCFIPAPGSHKWVWGSTERVGSRPLPYRPWLRCNVSSWKSASVSKGTEPEGRSIDVTRVWSREPSSNR